MWVYRFAGFELDQEGRELKRKGQTVRLPPKQLAVLRVLVSHAPKLLTRREILDAAWPGQVVGYDALNTSIKVLRRCLSRAGLRTESVRTVHGVGYAFALPVSGLRVSTHIGKAPRAWHESFVGRDEELERARQWLREEAPAALYVHGTAGIGKTTFLREVERLAIQARLKTISLTCNHFAPQPRDLLAELAAAVGAQSQTEVFEALSASKTEGVLIVDGCEALASAEDWLREFLWAHLPPHWKLAIADRRPPCYRWRADAAWDRVTVIALDALSPECASELLARRGVPAEVRVDIVAFCLGSPLALSLAAESIKRTERWSPLLHGEDGIISALFDAFVRTAPTMLHRSALDCAAAVFCLDERLLATMLHLEDASDLYAWLSSLGFVRTTRKGLVLHDLPRMALLAASNSPEGFASKLALAYRRLLSQTDRESWFHAVLSVLRLDTRFRHLSTDAGAVALRPDEATPADQETLATTIAKFEGVHSREIMRMWLARDPGSAIVFRRGQGAVEGFVVTVMVRPDDNAARRDPIVRAIDEALSEMGMARCAYSLVRFFADCHAYQHVTHVSLACLAAMICEQLVHPQADPTLAWSFVVAAGPEFQALSEQFSFPRLCDASVEMDGKSGGVYGHSWRAQGLDEWLVSCMSNFVRAFRDGSP